MNTTHYNALPFRMFVNISYRLINMATDGRGLDMILLDEAFHGIDSLGQEHIIRTLENVGITSMMITQNVSPDFAAKNKLIVRKIDKVSRYD